MQVGVVKAGAEQTASARAADAGAFGGGIAIRKDEGSGLAPLTGRAAAA